MGLDPLHDWGDGAPPDPGAELERLRKKLEEMRRNFHATREHLNPGIIGLDGEPTTIEGRREQERGPARMRLLLNYGRRPTCSGQNRPVDGRKPRCGAASLHGR